MTENSYPAPLTAKTGYPMLGSLLDLMKGPLDFVTELRAQHGDVVAFSTGLGNRSVLISHPDDIERVLLETGKAYSKGDQTPTSDLVFGNGLVTSEGDFWKRQRKLAAPAFHHQVIKKYAELMVADAQDMLATWQTDTVRDVYHDMVLLTQRIIMKALFSVDVLHDANAAGEAFDAMMRGLGAEMNGIDLILPPFIPTKARVETAEGARTINALLMKIMTERRAATAKPDDLLTMLMDARDDDGQPMSDKQLLDEIRTLYLAGHETTANTLTWTWHLLSQSPDVYARLKTEIDTVLVGRTVTVDDLQTLPYCGAVFKEALRCYPAAWVFTRTAIEDVVIGGYAVPKGTLIWISPWVVQRDPRWYTDPLTFRPERWLVDKAEQPPRNAYIAFGGGPRICIGNGFAMMEGALLLATILQRFEISVMPEPPVEIEAVGTIRPRNGLKAILRQA